MTIKASGFRIICDNPPCGRVETLPVTDGNRAVVLAEKLNWWVNAPDNHDYCPDCVQQLQAVGELPPRIQPQ